MAVPERGLYLLTPDGQETEWLLHALDEAIAGGAVMVQFRYKGASAAEAHARAEAVLDLCRSRDVPMLVNDDCALAARIGADGAHVGGNDLPVAEARRLLGTRAIVGASCYASLEAAKAAAAEGASYIAFGSVFASPTKPHAVRAPLELLRRASVEIPIPICAIGGITAANAAPVLAAGAGLLAVISDVFAAADPRAAAARFRPLFDS